MAVTITGDEPGRRGAITVLKFAWTSNSSQVASGTTSYGYNGRIVGLVTVPGAGAAAPSDNYGVVFTDKNGVDVLAGVGLLRDTANTEHVVNDTVLGYVADSQLTLGISAAGDTKSGVAYLYIENG